MFRRLLALSAVPLIVLAHLNAQAHEPNRPLTAAERAFAQVKTSPPELYAFLYRMPKGADLHNHLAGAVYAETFLAEAAADHLCINLKSMALVRPQTGSEGCPEGQEAASATQTNNNLENAMIDSLSMRDFVPGTESAHDHFFATFGKFNAVSSTHTGDYAAEVVRRAADQNESYLELMALSGGGAIGRLGESVGLNENDFDATRKKLEGAGLADLVAAESRRLDEIEKGRIAALGCDQAPSTPPCRVQVRYIFQVTRESAKPQVFAQVMAGFALAAADPRVVAVNFVQPEDGLTSMRDYHAQMLMVDYAHRIYPKIHITLHAGELAPGLVPPAGLRFHIREAVELGHAERIGHGVDVMYEQDPLPLLAEMHDHHIAVEINLTSNDLILGVKGSQHPFPVYLKRHVPVVISTDDEGVSRSQLTEEYERAVTGYNLTYSGLKDIVRNSLEYSFLAGASYWEGGNYFHRNGACAAPHGTRCQDFLKNNEKARLEANLEERFRVFEGSFSTSENDVKH